MATDQRRHFDPLHLLLKTPYNRTATHVCDICQAKLAGKVGYRCNACNVDIHEACADYFKETISFFAHPWHTLTLSRMPDDYRWSCDLCMEEGHQGSFVYRCIQCNFDVHPLCTMHPQTIRSPLHPEYELNMVVPSWGSCSACGEHLQMWHYACGFCKYKLHIWCIFGASSDSGQGAQGTGSGASSQTTSSSQTTAVRPSRSTRVAKFLLKTMATHAVFEVLKEAFV